MKKLLSALFIGAALFSAPAYSDVCVSGDSHWMYTYGDIDVCHTTSYDYGCDGVVEAYENHFCDGGSTICYSGVVYPGIGCFVAPE